MTTDTERREMARRLRECRDIRKFAEVLGFPWDVESDWTWSDVTARLADLIEPPHQCPYYDSLKHRCSFHDVPAVDRDALLVLADEMDGAYPDSRDVAVEYIEDYAHRIR